VSFFCENQREFFIQFFIVGTRYKRAPAGKNIPVAAPACRVLLHNFGNKLAIFFNLSSGV
jgi:hypothetical protein